MAPKRKSDAVVEATDSVPKSAATRSSSRGKPASASSAAAADSKKPASSSATSNKKQKQDKPAEAPATEEKKAKTGGAKKVGDIIDDVTLKNEDGKEVKLSSIWADSGLVLFSYPKASTPGCTTQACNFRDAYSEFEKLGWQVWGISTDTPNAQLKFKDKFSFGYSLLCDPQKELLKQIGWTDAKKRNHWVIGKGGKLLEAALGVKPKDDAENALEFVKSHKE